MNRIFVFAGATLVVLTVAVGLYGQAGSTQPQAPETTSNNQVALQDPKSNPVAMLAEFYYESGYTMEQATAIAHKKTGRPYEDVPLPDAPVNGAVLEDPNSCAAAILHWVFEESGWPAQEAADIAARLMNLPQEQTQCGAYLVRITYCDGSNEQTLTTYMNSRCWEDPDGNPHTDDGLMECLSCMCIEGYRWLSLTVSGLTSCEGLPDAGTCVQLRVLGESTSVNCDLVQIQCNCFSETSGAINCNNIECCCCNSKTQGCQGCPICSPPCPNP